MALDIESLRVRIGLAADDDSRDADIEAVLALATALAERYCGRRFAFARQTEHFRFPEFRALFVRRYPISMVHSVSLEIGGAVPSSSYRVHPELGEIEMARRQTSPVAVDYEGGYETYPPDLEWAILTLFDVLWAETYPAEGGGSGGGGIVEGTGEVKTVTIFGVGSITYDVGATAARASSDLLDSSRLLLEPQARLAWVLDTYRRMPV